MKRRFCFFNPQCPIFQDILIFIPSRIQLIHQPRNFNVFIFEHYFVLVFFVSVQNPTAIPRIEFKLF